MIEAAFSKRLGNFHLRADFSAGSETVVLFGHSGSGKSLTLAAIAGLLRPDQGRIRIGGETVFDSEARINLPPQRRGTGYVVQQLALFPHLTAAENIGYGLSGPKAQRRQRVQELVGLLGLDGLEDRLPRHLSGGQQQRVALARALAPEPRLLLLDEPFSALDSAIRQTLRRELVRLKERLGLTVLFVTHDLREAYALADQLVVFDAGCTVQAGARDEVFNRPRSRRVAELTEFRNVFAGVVKERGPEGLQVESGGSLLKTRPYGFAPGARVDLCIRPEQVLLIRHEPGPDDPNTHLQARIVEETAHGSAHTLLFAVQGSALELEVEIQAHPYEVLGVQERKEWCLQLRRDSLHVMPAAD